MIVPVVVDWSDIIRSSFDKLFVLKKSQCTIMYCHTKTSVSSQCVGEVVRYVRV